MQLARFTSWIHSQVLYIHYKNLNFMQLYWKFQIGLAWKVLNNFIFHFNYCLRLVWYCKFADCNLKWILYEFCDIYIEIWARRYIYCLAIYISYLIFFAVWNHLYLSLRHSKFCLYLLLLKCKKCRYLLH